MLGRLFTLWPSVASLPGRALSAVLGLSLLLGAAACTPAQRKEAAPRLLTLSAYDELSAAPRDARADASEQAEALAAEAEVLRAKADQLRRAP